MFVRLQYSVTEKAEYESASIYYKIQLDLFSMQNFTSKKYPLLNELINLYSAFCVLLYTQSALQSCGGSLLNHHQCAASTWMMRRLPQDNGASALTTHQLQVERRERVKEPIKWMGIIRRSWLTRVSGGNLARTPGLHPYSLREVPWDF